MLNETEACLHGLLRIHGVGKIVGIGAGEVGVRIGIGRFWGLVGGIGGRKILSSCRLGLFVIFIFIIGFCYFSSFETNSYPDPFHTLP